jgi:hypothetical protein
MKELEKSFIGTGEVKGFQFTQLFAYTYGYIYHVLTPDGTIHYEIFSRAISASGKRKFGDREILIEEQVRYPNSNSFGIWAKTTTSLERAKEILESFKK